MKFQPPLPLGLLETYGDLFRTKTSTLQELVELEESRSSQQKTKSGSKGSRISDGSRCRRCQRTRALEYHRLCPSCLKILLHKAIEKSRKEIREDPTWDRHPDENVEMEMHFDSIMLLIPPDSDWNCE